MLGAQGSYTLGDGEGFHVAADVVPVVDSSGAGDCFLGALAWYIARMPQLPLREVISRAGHIASVSVQRAGTQASYPARTALPPHLFEP